MMPDKDDSVAIYIPKEYIVEFSKVIESGLQEANLPRESRKNLTYWWKAESSLINDELNNSSTDSCLNIQL